MCIFNTNMWFMYDTHHLIKYCIILYFNNFIIFYWYQFWRCHGNQKDEYTLWIDVLAIFVWINILMIFSGIWLILKNHDCFLTLLHISTFIVLVNWIYFCYHGNHITCFNSLITYHGVNDQRITEGIASDFGWPYFLL